jgi:hypothetical protein
MIVKSFKHQNYNYEARQLQKSMKINDSIEKKPSTLHTIIRLDNWFMEKSGIAALHPTNIINNFALGFI